MRPHCRRNWFFPLLLLFRHSRVHLKEPGDTLRLGHLRGEAVGLHHGTVVTAVSLQEVVGHRRRVVEVGKAGVGILGTDIEDSLRRLSNEGLSPTLPRREGEKPRKIVVNHILRIAIVALQTATHHTHPRHVDVALQDAKVVKGGGGDDKDKVCWYRIII